MNERLKKIIFSKLYEDLSHLELIPYEDSIWIVDREEKMWYLEYEKSGLLWWRYSFFKEFFKVFSMERNEYEPIISEWVEEVLNCKVDTPPILGTRKHFRVEEVLNCKVVTPFGLRGASRAQVEEVLNCKVDTPMRRCRAMCRGVEEVLNCKVDTPQGGGILHQCLVEEVLNCKVDTPRVVQIYANGLWKRY